MLDLTTGAILKPSEHEIRRLAVAAAALLSYDAAAQRSLLKSNHVFRVHLSTKPPAITEQIGRTIPSAGMYRVTGRFNGKAFDELLPDEKSYNRRLAVLKMIPGVMQLIGYRTGLERGIFNPIEDQKLHGSIIQRELTAAEAGRALTWDEYILAPPAASYVAYLCLEILGKKPSTKDTPSDLITQAEQATGRSIAALSKLYAKW